MTVKFYFTVNYFTVLINKNGYFNLFPNKLYLAKSNLRQISEPSAPRIRQINQQCVGDPGQDTLQFQRHSQHLPFL